MVKRLYHQFFHDGFQIGKVDHHAVFGAAEYQIAADFHFEFIRVAVQVFALAVVMVEHVRHVE